MRPHEGYDIYFIITYFIGFVPRVQYRLGREKRNRHRERGQPKRVGPGIRTRLGAQRGGKNSQRKPKRKEFSLGLPFQNF